jgi:hypothetical protein
MIIFNLLKFVPVKPKQETAQRFPQKQQSVLKNFDALG